MSDAEDTSPLPLTEWKGKKVNIAVMSYRFINPDVHFSLYANYADYGPAKIGLIRAPKATEIHRSRSQVANRFLAGEAEYLLMVDDDMLLPFGNEAAYERLVLDICGEPVPNRAGQCHSISKIMEHGPEIGIVGGLYVARNAGRNPMAWDVDGATPQELRAGTVSGLKKCSWVATGFIRIHRSVFQKIKDAAPTKFKDIAPRGQAGGAGDYCGFFQNRMNHMGEDNSFCSRAREVGFQCYVDTDIKLGHVGEYVYMPGQK